MFDPYHKWLGIKPGQRPPTHYQLLGIEPDEQDPEVIEEAAVRQTTHLPLQIAPMPTTARACFNEVSQAHNVLLEPSQAEVLRRSPRPEPCPESRRAALPQAAGWLTPSKRDGRHTDVRVYGGGGALCGSRRSPERTPLVAAQTHEQPGQAGPVARPRGRRLVSTLGLVIVLLAFHKTARARSCGRSGARPAAAGGQERARGAAAGCAREGVGGIRLRPNRSNWPVSTDGPATSAGGARSRAGQGASDKSAGWTILWALLPTLPFPRTAAGYSRRTPLPWGSGIRPAGITCRTRTAGKLAPLKCVTWLPDNRHILVGSGGWPVTAEVTQRP